MRFVVWLLLLLPLAVGCHQTPSEQAADVEGTSAEFSKSVPPVAEAARATLAEMEFALLQYRSDADSARIVAHVPREGRLSVDVIRTAGGSRLSLQCDGDNAEKISRRVLSKIRSRL